MRNQLLTATAGEAIMAHRFKEYQPLKGGIPERQNGSLVSMELGQAIPYSIDKFTNHSFSFGFHTQHFTFTHRNHFDRFSRNRFW